MSERPAGTLSDAAAGRPPLTWLYVPGDRPDRIAKAIASEADVVILDLEDAVAPARKAHARTTVIDVLGGQARQQRAVEVRINDPVSDWGAGDLTALERLVEVGATFDVRMPKVDDPEVVRQVAARLGGRGAIGFVALIESALGVERAFDIATAHPQVVALGLGEADLATDLGVTGDAGLDWARMRVLNAARAADLRPVAMSAWLRLADPDGLAASCRTGRALGFLGRAAIHPAQLPAIEAAFLPSASEVEAARAVIDAIADAESDLRGGAVLADGRFVDRAHVAAARRTLALAERRH